MRLTDGGRNEQWSPADLVAKQTRDDGDDEVIDVEDAVLSYVRVSSLHEREGMAALTMSSCVVGSVTIMM